MSSSELNEEITYADNTGATADNAVVTAVTDTEDDALQIPAALDVSAILSDVEQLLDCPICLSLYHQPICTPCGHTICRTCLKRALDTAPICPVCRSPCFVSPATAISNVLLEDIIQRIIPLDKIQAREREIQQQLSVSTPISHGARHLQNALSSAATATVSSLSNAPNRDMIQPVQGRDNNGPDNNNNNNNNDAINTNTNNNSSNIGNNNININHQDQMRVGLFFLPSFYYPGQPIDLYVFEPRYLLLIRRCAENGSLFGIQTNAAQRRGVLVRVLNVQLATRIHLLVHGTIVSRYQMISDAPEVEPDTSGLYFATVARYNDDHNISEDQVQIRRELYNEARDKMEGILLQLDRVKRDQFESAYGKIPPRSTVSPNLLVTPEANNAETLSLFMLGALRNASPSMEEKIDLLFCRDTIRRLNACIRSINLAIERQFTAQRRANPPIPANQLRYPQPLYALEMYAPDTSFGSTLRDPFVHNLIVLVFTFAILVVAAHIS